MESAEARKARLKALREAAAGADEADVPSAAPEEPVLKFRNYAVRDQKNIEHTTVDAAQAPEFVAPVVEPSVVQEVHGEVSLHQANMQSYILLSMPAIPTIGSCLWSLSFHAMTRRA